MKNKNVVVKHKGHSNLDLESHHMSLCNDEILNQVQDDDRKGFTLIEVLIVVLIIAILAAVAVPQYQKAVMKSRYSALMPIAKSLANGNEAYYMDKGQYATSPTELDVSGQDEKYPDGTKVDMSSGEYSYVLAKRDNLPLNYLVYQKHSDKFADNIHCEADENNPMAQEVCQGLGGELISGSQTEGYLTYVLSGMVGANDKLPTSMSKLKAQICGTQFTGANCIVDETNQTVTTKQCGEAGSFSYMLENGRFYNNQYPGCKSLIYDQDGENIGTNIVFCQVKRTVNGNTVTNFDEETGSCFHPSGDIGTVYQTEYEYSADSYEMRTLSCKKKDSAGACTQYQSGVTQYNPNSSKRMSEEAYVCEGAPKADGTCNTYSVLTGRDAPQSTFYNDAGQWTVNYWCTMRDANGVCTSINNGNRSVNNDQGNASISCTTSHYYNTTPCAEYRITPNNGAATTCPADQFDIQTLTCAS